MFTVRMITVLVMSLLSVGIAVTEYKVTKKQIKNTHIHLSLAYTGNETYYMKQKNLIIKQLQFEFRVLGYSDFDFQIYDTAGVRFRVPQGGIFPKDHKGGSSYPIELSKFQFKYTAQPFTFQVYRRDGMVLFDSSKVDLIFSKYYIQIGTPTSTRQLYGLSERFTPHFRVFPGKWTIFPRDLGQNIDEGTGKQTHGYYPVYFTRQQSKSFHASYFRTSNAMDVIVQQHQPNNYLLTYKTIGGIIDFRFFIQDNNIEKLVRKFHQYLGQSAIPPFWSLGFHQSRWGYQNVSALKTVIANYEKNDIPLDTIWSDIDYMKDNQTFTIDSDRFPLQQMQSILQNYHYVPIIQPSIRDGEGYAYKQGIDRNVFIRDAEGNYQMGRVWAGDVLFTDYFHPNASSYWADMLQHLYDQVQFSGAWIDMNEISNLCNGPCVVPNATSIIDFTNDIPYQPGHDPIETQAIPLNATHHSNYLENDVHTFFGLMQAADTYAFLRTKSRPFVLTRSSTLGSNRYSFHWTGDNFANYTFLRTSIAGNFMFGFWGIKMVGADICGFGGNVTAQLCARWFQLGSLYPFARNHNQIQANDQQAYALGDVVVEASHKNLKLRYSLLKHYYSLFIESYGTNFIFKPLMFQFPTDQLCYKDEIAETQFMLGEFLMSAPILQQNATERQVYLPADTSWYDFHTGTYYENIQYTTINNKPSDLVPLFIRQNSAIFIQNVQKVHQNTHLDNQFAIRAAMKLIVTNTTVRTYAAKAKIISLNNYNNQTSVASCIKTSCNYQVKMQLFYNIQSNLKLMQLSILKSGNPIEDITINRLTIYTKDFLIDYTLHQPYNLLNYDVIYINIPNEEISML